MSDREVLTQAAAWLGAGRGVALATVVRTWSTAPRPLGSLLAVEEGGQFAGSVSGGCAEEMVVEAAREVIRTRVARKLTLGVTGEQARAMGLACGGTFDVALTPLDGPEVLAPLVDDLAARRTAVVALAPDGSSWRRLDLSVGGDEPLLLGARHAAQRDRSGLLELDGRQQFLCVHAPPVRLVVVGAVHVAQALVPMARLAGYETLVIDPRPAFATAARFPGSALSEEAPEAALGRLGPDRRTALVALSHLPPIDDPALATALRSEAFYVGALGSRRTHALRCARLAALGFSDEALARVHGPVGLDLAAEGPGEIAVSILAELVAALRRPGEVIARRP